MSLHKLRDFQKERETAQTLEIDMSCSGVISEIVVNKKGKLCYCNVSTKHPENGSPMVMILHKNDIPSDFEPKENKPIIFNAYIYLDKRSGKENWSARNPQYDDDLGNVFENVFNKISKTDNLTTMSYARYMSFIFHHSQETKFVGDDGTKLISYVSKKMGRRPIGITKEGYVILKTI